MSNLASPAALALWRAAALHPVTLPTGTRVLVRIPTVDFLVRQNAMPKELRAMAVQFATTSIDLAALDDADLARFFDLRDVMIAEGVRGLHADESCTEPACGDRAHYTDVRLSIEELAGLDDLDLSALGEIVTRQATTFQVTARSLGQRLEDSGETVPAWAAFRGDGRSAATGADGGTMASEAKLASGDKRPGNRARARRGAHDPARARRSEGDETK